MLSLLPAFLRRSRREPSHRPDAASTAKCANPPRSQASRSPCRFSKRRTSAFPALVIGVFILAGLLTPLGAQTVAVAGSPNPAAPLVSAQWPVSVAIPGATRPAFALLWIPPGVREVRGLVFGQQVILEDYIFNQPAFRAACTDQGLGIVLLTRSSHLGYFHYNKGSAELLEATLAALAATSGHPELTTAPLLPLGHSGNGIMAWNLAYWKPSRMIGVIGVHCSVTHPPAWDEKATVDGVPILGFSGHYESWDADRSREHHWRWLRGSLLEFRALGKAPLMSLLVEPGGGHFSANPAIVRHLAAFVRAACVARLPAKPGEPLRTIDPASGWLTDHAMLTPGRFPPTPAATFTGDPALAFWHLNEDLARSAEAIGLAGHGRPAQWVTFVQPDGQPLKPGWLPELKPAWEADGLTFRVAGAFLTQTPAGTADPVQPLTHAAGPIRFTLLGGGRAGGEQLGADRFRFTGDGPHGIPNEMIILAWHDGGATHAWTEQPVVIKRPKKNTPTL